ncbi:MAG TPA: glycosyltransferase family 4 protein [Longimicrobiales bacterium]
MSGRIHFLLPGRLDRRTGGTIYDARMIEELRRAGHDVVVHELAGRFPWPDGQTRAAATAALAAAEPGETTVVDGLAVAALDPTAPPPPDVTRVVLIHMPLDEERGLPYGVRALLRAAEDAWLRRADRVVCTSPFVAGRLVRRGAPAGGVAVVEPGVDAAPQPERNGHAGPIRLLAVGALTQVKGHATLVRALARITGLPWTLEIIGSAAIEPGTADALKNEVQRRGLAGRVYFPGELPPERVREAYARADVFVLPSLYESYGMVLAEAAAHGLPLVATRAGGIPATPAGRAALLVPPEDDLALARALEPLIENPAARARLASRAVDAARRMPSWEIAAREFALQLRAARV